MWFVVYSALFTPLAYAASAGGWTFSSFDAAKSLVTAFKNGASASAAVAKSPITSKIAKGIVGGVIAGAAIPLAISQLTGIALSAVDWVLDPANNAIKVKTTNVNGYPCSKNGQTAYDATSLRNILYGNNSRYTVKVDQYSNVWVYFDGAQQGTNGTCAPLNTISLPIPTVADKIFDNAKTDTASASIVNDAVKEYVNQGSADVALDAAKAEADASHACGSGTHWSGSACVADTPTTPTTPTTPDTPFDPTSIIDAIKGVFDAVMSLPDVINNALDDLLVDIKDFFEPVITKVTDMIDWFKSDPDPQTDSKPDIDTSPPTKSATDFDTDYLRFGGKCPATPSTSLSVGAVSVPLSIDLTPLCDFVVLVRPAIIAMAYLSALFVVARAIGETQ